MKTSNRLSIDDLPALLEVTPEKQAEIDAEQERLRGLFNSRARLSRQEYMKARGAELYKHHQITGDKDGQAEALALMGRYQEAAHTAVSRDLKQSYIEKHVAVTQADDDCDCDNFRIENGLRLPNQYIESYGWSEEHKAQMPFVRCTVCGNLNAKPMPTYLREQKEARARSLRGEDIKAEEFFKAR